MTAKQSVLSLRLKIAALQNLLEQTDDAFGLLLRDYRTEGCPDPDCEICKNSRFAERFAAEIRRRIAHETGRRTP